MKHVYATAYNVKKTLSFANTDSDGINQKIIQDIFLTRDLYLSSVDLTTLKTLHVFLENPSEFISNYFKGWKDKVRFLIEEPPSYHLNKNCEWFQKDFFNVEIPQKIKKKKLVKEARDWAKSHRDLLSPGNLEKFRNLFIEHFNGKYNIGLTKEDLKSIERPNSGQQIVNAKLEDVEIEIKRILYLVDKKFTRKQKDFFNTEFREKNYKYNNEYKSMGAYFENKLYWDLRFWRYSVVKPLNQNIQDYIFLKLNGDHKYDKNILEFLKFRPCRARDCA